MSVGRAGLVAAACLTNTATALMFRSYNVSSQWDTWAFVENGTFYAYYLVTEASPGEGFGCATSDDGQHWHDHGFVWHDPSWPVQKLWEGSSAIWRAPDFDVTGRYLINYSIFTKQGNQTITFAESFDLIHWSRPAPYNETWFNIDASAGYRVSHGRWDTIYSIPARAPGQSGIGRRDGFPRYGFWTATPTVGTMGFGVTHDGVHWKALPSPTMLPQPIGAEIGAVEYIPFVNGSGGAYYALLGTGWPRTMLAYSAPTPSGPYTRAAKNLNVVNGSCYFARFFRGLDDELLVTHQSWTNAGTHKAYVAPYKKAEVDDEGTLRLTFWPPNHKLKGAVQPAAYDPSRAGSGYFAKASNVSEGAVVEACFELPDADSPAHTWPGFLLELAGQPGAEMVAITAQSTVAIGTLVTQASVNFSAAGVSTPVAASSPTADWSFRGGVGAVGTRVPGGHGSDMRSGGPGGNGCAMSAHPLDGRGHMLTAVSLSFQYVAGYTPPAGQHKHGSTATLALLDAFNDSLVATLWTSPELSNYSFDHYTRESPPVIGGASGLSISWPRQTRLALCFANHERNVQLPLETLELKVAWGAPQTVPWTPLPLTIFVLREDFLCGNGPCTWTRDRPFGAPGASVRARLLYRRDMIEMYVDELLYPVMIIPPSTGRLGVNPHAATPPTNVRRWAMSLPGLPGDAESDWVLAAANEGGHDDETSPPSPPGRRGR